MVRPRRELAQWTDQGGANPPALANTSPVSGTVPQGRLLIVVVRRRGRRACDRICPLAQASAAYRGSWPAFCGAHEWRVRMAETLGREIKGRGGRLSRSGRTGTTSGQLLRLGTGQNSDQGLGRARDRVLIERAVGARRLRPGV